MKLLVIRNFTTERLTEDLTREHLALKLDVLTTRSRILIKKNLLGFLIAFGVIFDGPPCVPISLSRPTRLGGGGILWRLVLLKLEGGRCEHRSRRGI